MQTINLSEDKREAFEALQTAYNVQRKQFAIASKQIELAEREKKRAALTLGEVEALPAGTITYKSVGKMFLQFPADKLVAEYHEEAAKREQQIQELSAKRGGAQAGIGAAEQKLREFLEKANQPGAGGNALESVSEE